MYQQLLADLRHYEETGVLLSYGKAVAKMEQQKVRKTA